MGWGHCRAMGLCGQQLGPSDPNYLYLGDGAAIQWGRCRGGMCPGPTRTQPGTFLLFPWLSSPFLSPLIAGADPDLPAQDSD